MGKQDRKAVRVKLRLTAFMKFVSTGKVVRVLTKDISGLGMSLVTDGTLELGTELELEITLPDRETPITCGAEVVWSKATEEIGRAHV